MGFPILLAALGVAPMGLRAPDPIPVAQPNDNRIPAGELKNGVLTIHLVVKLARWYPEAPDGPFAVVPAIAEEGKAPQIPAPLIRVPAGTTIVATVRNELPDSTVYMRGLFTHPAKALDSIPIGRGESRTIRFSAGSAGAYPYLATPGLWNYAKGGEREASGGAIVIDPPGALPRDRIFVINIWGDLVDATHYSNALAINGRSWPFTERISGTTGDTLRWRVVNLSIRNHPMHLHGFYFRIDERGTATADTVYSERERRMAVTESLDAGETMYMVWSPNRPGNWLFHCHLSFHVAPGGAQLANAATIGHRMHAADIREHMSGLVLGISVRPSPATKPVVRSHARSLHLFVNEGRRRRIAPRSLGFVLQRGAAPAPADSVELPGSLLVLTRGEPTDITVVNRLNEATSIHWHGIELESYSDGVAGWSGIGDHLAPVIAAHDSFTAHLTLPRAGTFIYHTHLNDIEQLTSGLYGAIIVLEPGKKFDPSTDHVFVVGWDGPKDPPDLIVNGDTTGAPIEIRAGVPQRFRFIDIGPAARMVFAIRRDTSIVWWRPLAKDGAALSASVAVEGPATKRLDVGETFDAEFTAPVPGEYVLTMGRPKNPLWYRRRVIAR